MLKRPKEHLAHLFFHELTHRTFWSSGSVKFNENLAEFVATKLTIAFLKSLGEEKVLQRYTNYRADRLVYKKWVSRLKNDLKTLYGKKLNHDEMSRRKKDIFNQYVTKNLPDFESKYFKFVARKKWNNASVLGVSLYLPDQEHFHTAYRCFGSEKRAGEFLARLKQYEKVMDDAFQALDRFCSEKASTGAK